MDAIPQQLQDKLMQFQEMQNQLQSIAFQGQQMRQQLLEIDHALEVLEGSGDNRVYERAGPLFIESDAGKTKDKLKDDKELKEARLKSLEKQESKLREKLSALGKEIQGQMGGVQSGGVVAE